MIRFVFIDSGVNLKVLGLTGTWGGVGIEMPKFEAKKGDFAKIWRKLGGGGAAAPCPPAPPSMVFCAWSQKVSVCRSKRF